LPSPYTSTSPSWDSTNLLLSRTIRLYTKSWKNKFLRWRNDAAVPERFLKSTKPHIDHRLQNVLVQEKSRMRLDNLEARVDQTEQLCTI
jgi:hypothetical protein